MYHTKFEKVPDSEANQPQEEQHQKPHKSYGVKKTGRTAAGNKERRGRRRRRYDDTGNWYVGKKPDYADQTPASHGVLLATRLPAPSFLLSSPTAVTTLPLLCFGASRVSSRFISTPPLPRPRFVSRVAVLSCRCRIG